MKRVIEDNYKAQNFMLWLCVFSSFMFFAALTSAFIVHLSSSSSQPVPASALPKIFVFSTVVIILSSYTLHLAVSSAKAELYKKQKKYLLVTMALGVLFIILQFIGWKDLIAEQIVFASRNAGDSFIYVFTGFHLIHVLGGLCFLAYPILKYKADTSVERNQARLYKASVFWHFIGVVWVYLYVFLLVY